MLCLTFCLQEGKPVPGGWFGASGKEAEVRLGIPPLQSYQELIRSLAQLKAAQQSSCIKMHQLC